MKLSQKNKIKDYLQKGNSITPAQAWSMFGCMRLADVIFKLKKEMTIETKMIEWEGSRFASYSAVKKASADDYRKASGG